MRQPKIRSDLKFQPMNLPEAVELDYSDDITSCDFDVMDKAMPDEAKKGGILISGERW